MVTSKQFYSRYEQARDLKTTWSTMYDEVMSYVNPQRNTFFREEAHGEKKNNPNLVYDSTAQNALDAYVSKTQNALFPIKRKWLKLVPGITIRDKSARDQLGLALEEINDIHFAYLHMSNFDSEASSALHELGLGVFPMLVNQGTVQSPLSYTAIPLSQLYLNDGPYGRVGDVFRKTNMTPRNIVGTWPEARLTKEMQDALNNEKSTVKFCLIDGVTPTKVKVGGEKIDGFTYMVVDERTKVAIYEQPMTSNPFIIGRLPTNPGEVWPRGPLVRAISDIKAINMVKELLLKKASFDTFPQNLIEAAGVMNPEVIGSHPGANIIVDSSFTGNRRPVEPYNTGGNLNLAQFVFQDIQQGIQKALISEEIGNVNLPVKSATEIAIRQQQAAELQSSMFGRLQHELIVPLVSRNLRILENLELIDLDGAKDADGRLINIDFQSPLAQAQAKEEILNFAQYAEMILGMFGPQVGLAMLNPQEVVPWLAGKYGVDKQLVPTDDDFEIMKQGVTEQALTQGLQDIGAIQGAG